MSRLEYSELVLGPFEILTNLGLDPLTVRLEAQRMISDSKVHWKGRKRGRGHQKQQLNHRLRGASNEGKVGVVDKKEVQIKM